MENMNEKDKFYNLKMILMMLYMMIIMRWWI